MLLAALVTSYLSTEMLCRGGCGSHSATLPLSHSVWLGGHVAAPATFAGWLSGWPQPFWQSGWVAAPSYSDWVSGWVVAEALSRRVAAPAIRAKWLNGWVAASIFRAVLHIDTKIRRCQLVPRLPHKSDINVTQFHPCHIKCLGVRRDQARHQT